MKPANLILLFAFALSACGGSEAPPEDAKAAPKAEAKKKKCKKGNKKCKEEPEAEVGLSLSEGRLALPAVAGNPAAAYFTLANKGKEPQTVAAVAVGDAQKSEMHETKGGKMTPLDKLQVKPGETVAFLPGGKHVMVFGLTPQAASGASVEVTLTFADGDKLSSLLTVEKAGAVR